MMICILLYFILKVNASLEQSYSYYAGVDGSVDQVLV